MQMARAVGFEPTISGLEPDALNRAKLRPYTQGVRGAKKAEGPAKRPSPAPEDSPWAAFSPGHFLGRRRRALRSMRRPSFPKKLAPGARVERALPDPQSGVLAAELPQGFYGKASRQGRAALSRVR
jgi:hypothetical protein